MKMLDESDVLQLHPSLYFGNKIRPFPNKGAPSQIYLTVYAGDTTIESVLGADALTISLKFFLRNICIL